LVIKNFKYLDYITLDGDIILCQLSTNVKTANELQQWRQMNLHQYAVEKQCIKKPKKSAFNLLIQNMHDQWTMKNRATIFEVENKNNSIKGS
jgi:hypothetical protein